MLQKSQKTSQIHRKSKKSIPQRPSKQSTSITNNDDTDYSPLIKDNQQTTSHNVLNNILTCDFQRASLKVEKRKSSVDLQTTTFLLKLILIPRFGIFLKCKHEA